jgi:hypothetical protein
MLKRNIIQEINKIAQEYDSIPLPSTQKSSPSVSSKPTGYVANNDISRMQKAIQNFAAAAVKYKTVPVNKNGKLVKEVDKNDTRRDFNDFLVEQFANNAELRGDEYSPDPGDTTLSSKQPTDLIQLDNVIDQLRRTGSQINEKLPDGSWETRTNNAVRNVYALAVALVEANEALGGTSINDRRVFTRSDLAAFKAAIPPYKDPVAEGGLTKENLSQRAVTITKLVNKLTEFYDFYSKTILDHPAYKSYIDQTKALLTVEPGKDPTMLNEADQKRLEQSKDIRLPFLRVLDKDNRPINIDGNVALDYLQSKQGLQKLMVDFLKYQPNEVNSFPAMRKTVNNLIDRINKIIATNRQSLNPIIDKNQIKEISFDPNSNIA